MADTESKMDSEHVRQYLVDLQDRLRLIEAIVST